jgi:hypothetical protein
VVAVRVFDHGGGGGMAGRAEDYAVTLAPAEQKQP